MALDFSRKEKAAAEHSEGSDWEIKQKVLENHPAFTNDRLDVLGVEKSVRAPFDKLSVQLGMTVPFVVEAVYPLSLALYFGQQDEAFYRGSIVYDRCISLRTTLEIANHSAAFTWRFHDDDHDQQSETGNSNHLIAGIKSEKVAFRAFKMCYVNTNRKGAEGVNISIRFHLKWLEEQRRQGSKVDLVDIYSDALKFCAENHADLQKLSPRDLQKAILPQS